MTDEQITWIEGTKLWLEGQMNLVAQSEAAIEYSQKEIQLHQAGIENSIALKAHYQKEIDRTQGILDQYIKDNQ